MCEFESVREIERVAIHIDVNRLITIGLHNVISASLIIFIIPTFQAFVSIFPLVMGAPVIQHRHCLKATVHPKFKNVIIYSPSKTCMTFFYLQNRKDDTFENVGN